ncbi:hypothetical protein Ancab_038068, partial [Ancistrocladus abbreviatus]
LDSLIASRWTVLYDALGSRQALRRLLRYGTNVRAAPSIWKIVLVQGASGVVASATASCITTPLDTVKTRLQGIDGYLEHELELSAFEDQVDSRISSKVEGGSRAASCRGSNCGVNSKGGGKVCIRGRHQQRRHRLQVLRQVGAR